MPEITDSAARLKKRIRNGETVLGVSVPMTMSRNELAAIVESGPYDFVGIDIQHAPYDENVLVSFCQKAAEIGVHTQFRIKHTTHLSDWELFRSWPVWNRSAAGRNHEDRR